MKKVGGGANSGLVVSDSKKVVQWTQTMHGADKANRIFHERFLQRVSLQDLPGEPAITVGSKITDSQTE